MREIGLEERKRIQLEIMKQVDAFCRANQLTYYLAFGTLIGAIRHKGYIPWDDDIDIMMPRADYEKMEHLFPKEGNYRFLTPNNTEKYPYAFGKVIDTRTIKKESYVWSKYQIIGLDIDVFPIDNYPDDEQEAISWCKEIDAVQKKLFRFFAIYVKGRNFIRVIYKNSIIAFRRFLDNKDIYPIEKIVSQLVSLSQKYNGIESHYCGVSSINTYGVHKRNRKEIFASKIEVNFEGNCFFAPIGYDEYLRDIYGDYMVLPPIEKQKTHHSFSAYWK